MLLRYVGGETKVWSVVQVPTPEEVDARQLHRELITLRHQTTEHINRIDCGLRFGNRSRPTLPQKAEGVAAVGRDPCSQGAVSALVVRV